MLVAFLSDLSTSQDRPTKVSADLRELQIRQVSHNRGCGLRVMWIFHREEWWFEHAKMMPRDRYPGSMTWYFSGESKRWRLMIFVQWSCFFWETPWAPWDFSSKSRLITIGYGCNQQTLGLGQEHVKVQQHVRCTKWTWRYIRYDMFGMCTDIYIGYRIFWWCQPIKTWDH